MEACPRCGKPCPPDRDRCANCGHDIGFPNVRDATVPAERATLTSRYQDASDGAVKRGAGDVLTRFADAVANQSQAVVNVDADYLLQFLQNDKALYSTYSLLTRAETRLAGAAPTTSGARGWRGRYSAATVISSAMPSCRWTVPGQRHTARST